MDTWHEIVNICICVCVQFDDANAKKSHKWPSMVNKSVFNTVTY